MKGRIKRTETEVVSNKMPIIGKIKVGQKSEKGTPQSTDYFICTSKYERFFREAYGDKPETIQIIFVSDNFLDSCFERYECRDAAGRLAGYGDGEEMFVYNSKNDRFELENNRESLKALGKWETVLTIRFVIPKIKGVMGLFQFTTKANKSTIPQIREAFDMVQTMAGTVVKIPFDLTVNKVMSQKPGTKFKFPVVNLIPNIAQENLTILNNYLSQGKTLKELPVGIINNEIIEQIKLNQTNGD